MSAVVECADQRAVQERGGDFAKYPLYILYKSI
jgi:hypothetical protein